VFDAVWAAVEPLLPAPPKDDHPLGCHQPRASDRFCFQAKLVRLVMGCSWVDAEHLLDGAVSDTTLCSGRDEWGQAGVFAAVVDEALYAYDRVIGLDLSEAAVDGSQHPAPTGGEGTGRNPSTSTKPPELLAVAWSGLAPVVGILQVLTGASGAWAPSRWPIPSNAGRRRHGR
jgi:hypothetical protein